MIGPIQFTNGLWRGSRPQTDADWKNLEGFAILDLERMPAKRFDAWFPLQSVFPPLKFRVAMVLNTLLAQRSRPVFMHCRSGVDRTGFVVAKYRVLVQGWSKADARKEMKEQGNHWWLAWWRLFV